MSNRATAIILTVLAVIAATTILVGVLWYFLRDPEPKMVPVSSASWMTATATTPRPMTSHVPGLVRGNLVDTNTTLRLT
jgi:hypothetical protein